MIDSKDNSGYYGSFAAQGYSIEYSPNAHGIQIPILTPFYLPDFFTLYNNNADGITTLPEAPIGGFPVLSALTLKK